MRRRLATGCVVVIVKDVRRHRHRCHIPLHHRHRRRLFCLSCHRNRDGDDFLEVQRVHLHAKNLVNA